MALVLGFVQQLAQMVAKDNAKDAREVVKTDAPVDVHKDARLHAVEVADKGAHSIVFHNAQ